jgi:hypothetical protein
MSHKCQSILHGPKGRLLGELASVSADLAHGHVIPEHSHPEDQLLFASSGVMTLHTRQGVWVMPPLRAVWIPADTPHSVAMSGPVSMRTLYFLPRLCPKISEKCFAVAAGADSSCLQVQEVEQESFGETADYRDDRGSIEDSGFHSVAVAASDGRASDARGGRAAG